MAANDTSGYHYRGTLRDPQRLRESNGDVGNHVAARSSVPFANARAAHQVLKR